MIPTDIITEAQLKDVSANLKAYYTNWAILLSEAISKDKEWKAWTNNPCTEQNTRNIGYGIIKGQQHRRIFMRCAAKLIFEAVQQNSEINNSLKVGPLEVVAAKENIGKPTQSNSETTDERSVANQAQ